MTDTSFFKSLNDGDTVFLIDNHLYIAGIDKPTPATVVNKRNMDYGSGISVKVTVNGKEDVTTVFDCCVLGYRQKGYSFKAGDRVVIDASQWTHLTFSELPALGTMEKDGFVKLDVPAIGSIEKNVKRLYGPSSTYLVNPDKDVKREREPEKMISSERFAVSDIGVGDLVYVDNNAVELRVFSFKKLPLVCRVLEVRANGSNASIKVERVNGNYNSSVDPDDAKGKTFYVELNSILGRRRDGMEHFERGERILIDHTTWGWSINKDQSARVYATVNESRMSSVGAGSITIEDTGAQKTDAADNAAFHIPGIQKSRKEGKSMSSRRVVLSEQVVRTIIDELETVQDDRYEREVETDNIIGALRACVESREAPTVDLYVAGSSGTLYDADKVLEFAQNPLLEYFRRDD